MNPYFERLGRTVYERWQRKNFSLPAFSSVAVKALNELPPSEYVDLPELIRDFLLDDEQPFQTSSGFGQPELIVHDNPRFYIQVLFWLDGTTDIHQHVFSGAFHVMAGSSLHSTFDFENPIPVTARFQLGDLKLRETRLLETGTTVPIVSGPHCIHSLFHLETPSVTVVVRTHSDPGTDPQFTYLPPHVAIDPVHHDALTMRRKQLLDVLETTGDESYPDLVLEMLGALDLERGFLVLQNCVSLLRSLGAWDKAWNRFSKKHGNQASRLSPVLDEIIRRDAIVSMRSMIEDVEHRFFLALLLNIPERDVILKMVGLRFPGKPLETIMRWAAELIQISETGAWLLDARLPESTDGETDTGELQEASLSALRQFISGVSNSGHSGFLKKRELSVLRAVFENSSWRVLAAPSVSVSDTSLRSRAKRSPKG
jgi:hypothetical protein